MPPKKQKPIYNGIEFDSPEEIEFYQWCEEAVENNIISSFVYHPNPYILSEQVTYTKTKVLKTKIKEIKAELLKPHVYTPDFWVIGVKRPIFKDSVFYYKTIDVKGSFSRFNDDKSFSINQKWMYQKHGIYVEKIIPEKFFRETWVPQKARYTPAGKLKKKYIGYKTINEYLKKGF